MKQYPKVFLLSIMLLTHIAAQTQTLKLDVKDYTKASCTFSLDNIDMQMVEAEGNPFTVVTFNGSVSSQQVGTPDLPIYSQLIEIPVCSEVVVEVTDVTVRTLGEGVCKYPLMPVQPSPSKSQRERLPFAMDSALYATDDIYSHPLAWIEPVGIARDRNLAHLFISPISYNPVTGELRQVTSMKVNLKYKNADMAETQRIHNLYSSPDFSIGQAALYALPETKEVRRDAPVHYLIVAHSSFRGQLDSLITWKKRRGFLVTIGYTGDAQVGTTNTQIADYIKSFYTNATAQLPAPTYLLLVGDHQQIPAFSARCGSPATNHVTDLYYATWTAGDHIPDCYYGRFSARSVAELTPQVEKTIYYESYGFPDDDYLGRGVLIAGVDRRSPGDWAYQYADPAMDYIASLYVNSGHGFTNVSYYKNNISYEPTGVTVTGSSQTSNTANTLRSLYDLGCGFVNYSAHGYDDSWSIPEFNTWNVSQMTNYGRPSIMIGNCCLSGKFNTTAYDACLGEALLRKTDNAGAAAYIGGTNSTYWPEDFNWAVGVRNNVSGTMVPAYDANNIGVYDRLFHTHNEAYTDWHTTMGSMVMAGNMAVQSSGSSRAYYYWEIYELFGDPSLMPWLGRAAQMNVSAPSPANVAEASYSVTVPAHAYVALVDPQDFSLIAAAYADESGSATLTLPSDMSVGTYQLAVTAQNYKPYFQNVEFVVLNGPYVIITSLQPSNGKLVPGHSTTFDATIKNIGNAYPTQGLLYLNCDNPGVVISRAEEHFSALAPGDSTTLTGLWLTYVPDTYTDHSMLTFSTEVNFGEGTAHKRHIMYTTTSALALAHAESQSTIYSNTANTITCQVVNNGHDSTPALSLMLPNLFGFMTEQPMPQPLAPLAPGQSATVSFPVQMSANLPTTLLRFALHATDGQDTFVVAPFQLPSGYSAVEDFETGDFTRFDWSQGTYPWVVTNVNPMRGSFSARTNNNLGNRSESRMSISWTSTIDDSISFYVKASTEYGFDKFRFYIDGLETYSTSGEQNWTRISFPVTAGSHIFSFSYNKDYSTSAGEDCIWIDDINLPFFGEVVSYTIDTICQNGDYYFADTLVPTAQVGHLTMSDSTNTSFLSLQVVPQPEVQIEVIGQLGLGQCVLLKATGATSYTWNTGDTLSCIAVCPEQGSTYQVTGCHGGCCGETSITLLGIGQATSASTVSVYPNPATEAVTIAADNMRSVRIINLMGQTVTTIGTHSSQLTIPLQNLPKGIYFVSVETAQTVSTSKLLIK